MAILGQIRQRSFFLIFIIGMALFAFVISGVFDGNNNGGGPTDPIAIVNDEEMSLDTFRFQVEQTERNYGFSTLQAVRTVWNQSIQNTILNQQFEALGIDAGKEQIEQIISQNPAFVSDERFMNEFGVFDFGLFTGFINLMKDQNPVAYDQWKIQEANLVNVARQNIYLDLIKSSTGFTEEEGKLAYHIENDKINMEFVQVPLDAIDDDLVEVTDADIQKYIKANAEEYQTEATTRIRYVTFADEASPEDEAFIYAGLEKLLDTQVEYNDVSKLTDTLDGFRTTKDIFDFVEKHSEVPFDSVYLPKGRLASEYAESLFSLKNGEVFGPFKDGNTMKLARMLDKKRQGSIRASHILIAYDGVTNPTPGVTRSKEEAQRLANRLLRQARRNPDDFESLARNNSDGPSKTLGGDLGFYQEGAMAPEFFNYTNRNRVGRIGLVETDFGFHIIKITDKEDIVLLAEIVKQIVPSDETSNIVFRSATELEIAAKESKDLAAAADKEDLNLEGPTQIDILDELIPGIGLQRNIVQWAFEKSTAVGTVRRFSLSQGGYAVVQLSEKTKAGLQSVAQAAPQVRRLVEDQKRLDLLTKKYATTSSLEELAEASDSEIKTASAMTQENTTLAGVGQEPYVIGVAFSLEAGETSSLIQGNEGVYLVRVNSKEVAPELPSYVAYANSLQEAEKANLEDAILEALKSVADITDNRALYY
ncbi:MAG: peptidylprolyl isomerase [Flavobacteriaceae bacterium]